MNKNTNIKNDEAAEINKKLLKKILYDISLTTIQNDYHYNNLYNMIQEL